MPEPMDETDGTPEWAKRMFRRLRVVRTGAFFIFLIMGLPIMCGYQIYQALAAGQVWRLTLRRSSEAVRYAEEPVHFILGLALAISLLIVWGMGLALYHRVRKVPKHFKRPAGS